MAEKPAPNLDMQTMLKQAQQMQKQMQKAQQEIVALKVTGEAGGGLVKIVMNGAHHVQKVEISPTLMGEEEEMLEDLVAAAFNDASKKVEEATKQKMVDIAKDMNLPTDGGAIK